MCANWHQVLITLSITNFLKQGFKKLLSHVLLPFLLLNFTAPSAHAQPNVSVQFHIERIKQYQHPNNTSLRRVDVLQEPHGY